jgi:hypothetical protein
MALFFVIQRMKPRRILLRLPASFTVVVFPVWSAGPALTLYIDLNQVAALASPFHVTSPCTVFTRYGIFLF